MPEFKKRTANTFILKHDLNLIVKSPFSAILALLSIKTEK